MHLPRLNPASAATLTISALVILQAGEVRSHAIESSLERLSALNAALQPDLVLSSRYGNGEPAGDAVVRLMTPDGEAIELGRTDQNGSLRFQLPSQANASWEVQIDAGPGHRDYLELAETTPLPATAPTPGPEATTPIPQRLSTQPPQQTVPSPSPLGLLLGLSAAGMLVSRQRHP
jgi:nickel transport protein